MMSYDYRAWRSEAQCEYSEVQPKSHSRYLGHTYSEHKFLACKFHIIWSNIVQIRENRSVGFSSEIKGSEF